MECQFRGSKIFYEYFDFGGETANIYLHGWGRSCKELLLFKDHIKQSSLFIDFPPFGKSDKKADKKAEKEAKKEAKKVKKGAK